MQGQEAGNSDPRAFRPDWLPTWTSELDLGIWVIDGAARVRYLNERGEALLGWRRPEWQGRALHEVVCGGEPGSEDECTQDCALTRRLGKAVWPRPLQRAEMVRCRPRSGTPRWIQVFSARLDSELGPMVLQMGHDLSRWHVVFQYLKRLATRSVVGDELLASPYEALSPRELEILRHLARDEDPQRIARVLHLSPTTVRNHVSHILHKLGVHSIQEAIALHLVRDPPSSAGVGDSARFVERARPHESDPGRS